jgi:hypothetical protein
MPSLTQAQKYYSDITSGDPGVMARATMPQINASREAYGRAADQIAMTAPKGGQRDQALTSLAQGQAGDVSKILTGGIQDAYNHLESIGQFGTSGALQGYGTATQAGSSLAQLSAAKAQAVGSGIAGIAGAAGGGLGKVAAKPSAPVGGGGAVGVINPNSMGPGY